MIFGEDPRLHSRGSFYCPLAGRQINQLMSKTKGKTKTSRRKPDKPMKGCEILVAALEREAVDTIFAYPGGTSMELHQALTKSKQIRTILPRHEQGGAFAAGGYARATGKVGVCMATSGPGATNLVTGIADAWMDSVPLVALTGQVPQAMIGKGAFQETDFYGMTLGIVKHSYLITDIREIPRVVKQAFHIAHTGRMGPVIVDFPKNIQQQVAKVIWPDKIDLPGYRPFPKANDHELNEIIGLIEKSKRPVLYIGGGIITGDASRELRTFAKATNIPVTTTMMGVGAFPEDHKLSLRWLGMHGAAYANWAVSGELRKDTKKRMRKIADGADLLLAFGVRFDDRVTGKVDKFCETGTIVHVDIDRSEHNKNRRVQLPIHSDVRYALRKLCTMVKARPIKTRFTKWHKQIAEWKQRAPLRYKVTKEVMNSSHMKDHLKGKENQVILPQHAVATLYELTKGNAIITTGVGQHQMWGGQHYRYKFPRQFITSAGLGAMGFGYPAAMGAKIAYPNKEVIDIDGDGSFLMNIQELATAKIEKIAAKALILNNQHLGMVVQWEDRFYKGNRGHTYLGDPENPKAVYPDYPAICAGFGVKCVRVMYKEDLPGAIKRMLASKEPYVLDVITPYTEHVLPFIPAGHTVADMIY